MKTKDIDLHVFAKPADANCVALFTVSQGRRSVCIDLPLEDALRYIANELREAVGEESE